MFKETIEMYRYKEVLDSICRIVAKFQIEDLKKHVQNPQDTLSEVQCKLNKSLGDDISYGNYYPEGHIGNFRINQNYFDKWLK